MAIQLFERVDSQSLNNSNDGNDITLSYIATGSSDAVAIRNTVIDSTPRSYWGLFRKSLSVVPRGGNTYWDVEVVYSSTTFSSSALGTPSGEITEPDLDEPLGGGGGGTGNNSLGYSFTMSGGTTHISQSLSTVSAWIRTAPNVDQIGNLDVALPDFKQAINATKEGVGGVDIVSPTWEMSVECRRDLVTLRFFNTLFSMTGTVNNARWQGFEAGELLYLGCDGQFTAGERWRITHKFAAEKNKQNLIISPGASGLSVGSKKGWDYLWVGYSEKRSAGGYRVRIPEYAYVEQVYRYDNFRKLEIG